MNDLERKIENELYHSEQITRLCSCGWNYFKHEYAEHLQDGTHNKALKK